MIKKIWIFFGVLLALFLLVLVLKWYDNRNIENYKNVADYIFDKTDNNDLSAAWFTYNSLLNECKDNSEIYSIIKANENQFSATYVMCNEEIAFKRKGMYIMGVGGIAIVRNGAKPVKNAEKNGLREVIYKEKAEGIYRWTTGFFIL